MWKYDIGLISRALFALISFVNALAAVFNLPQFDTDEQTVYLVVSFLAALGAFIAGFWKNNNFTQEAQIAQQILDDMKDDNRDTEKELLE